ncbi:PolC-type DNA polymerase III [Lacticaseibacillus parakribbianus]|uniref:3'-5' exonuclease n=1 Tax=Lacticaseibacillus parakribbianus TaxID=2970927 RepID=UPI0021CB3122
MELKAIVQQPLTAADWPVTIQTALQALATLGGGTKTQVAVLPVGATTLVQVEGLWPARLTLAGCRVAAPSLTPHVELWETPRPGQPVDKVIRKLIAAYVATLRDPAQLPAQLSADWGRVRAVANHLQALQAVCHRLRLEPDRELTVTLYGPVAAETATLLEAAGLPLVRREMMTPWPQAFTAESIGPIVLGGPKVTHWAGPAQRAAATARAKALVAKRYPQAVNPAFTKREQALVLAMDAPVDYTVFDLEFSSGNAREGWFITEIGALKVRRGRLVGAFNTFVKIPANLHLNLQSQRMTALDARLLNRYGQAPDAALAAFLGFVGDDELLGFSVRGGDLAVLRRQFALYPQPKRVLDVAKLAEDCGPMPGMPEVSLSKYRIYLGLNAVMAHGALYDALTTHALYAYLQGRPVVPAAAVAKVGQLLQA